MSFTPGIAIATIGRKPHSLHSLSIKHDPITTNTQALLGSYFALRQLTFLHDQTQDKPHSFHTSASKNTVYVPTTHPRDSNHETLQFSLQDPTHFVRTSRCPSQPPTYDHPLHHHITPHQLSLRTHPINLQPYTRRYSRVLQTCSKRTGQGEETHESSEHSRVCAIHGTRYH